MRRLLTAALLLVSVFALGQDRNRRTLGRNHTSSAVLLEFAPASGAGLPSISDLCDTYSSEMTGAYFCQRGDGTSLSGSQTLTAIAAPTTASAAVCPNGTDCTALSSVRFNGTTQWYETANAASPTGDFSVCAVISSEDASTNPPLVAKDDGATRVFYLRQASDSSTSTCVYKAGAVGTCVATAASTVATLVWNFACVTYDYVSDGTSILTPYANGTAGTASTTAVGPPAVGSSKFQIAQYGFGTFKGRQRGAFYTEKVLTPAVIAAMARTVLADTPTGTRGEALSISRNSVKFCPLVNQSAGSWLAVNRPCIVGGGIQVSSAGTNLAIRNTEFATGWAVSNVTAVTEGTTTAPDGTSSADTLVNSGPGGFIESTVAAISGADGAASVYVRSVSGTQDMAIKLRDNTAAADRCTATLTATTTWQRVYCTMNNTGVNGNSHSVRIYPGGVAGIATNSIIVWGAQMENTDGPSDLIKTAGTSATRTQEITSLPWPVAPSSDFSISADVVRINRGTHYPINLKTAADFRQGVTYSLGVANAWSTLGRDATDGYVFPSQTAADVPADGATRHVATAWNNLARTSNSWVYNGATLLGTSPTLARTNGIADGATLWFISDHSGFRGSLTKNVCVGRTQGACQ